MIYPWNGGKVFSNAPMTIMQHIHLPRYRDRFLQFFDKNRCIIVTPANTKGCMEPLWRMFAIMGMSYLIGSFPTGYVIGKAMFGIDIRTQGSGNIGSTNVMRVLGFRWGLVVQLVDILKGTIPVVIASMMVAPTSGGTDVSFLTDPVAMRIVAGAVAVIGHVFSFFTNFKGGKGVNTSLGMLLAIAPIDVGVAAACFFLLLFSTGYVSLGSVIGAVVVPLSVLIRHHIFGAEIDGYGTLLPFLVAVAALVIFAHKTNIKRLLNGTENRFEKARLFKR